MKKQSAVAAVGAFTMALTMSTSLFAQQVVISGSGSGAFEATAAGAQNNAAVAQASCTVDRTAQTIACQANVYNLVDLTAQHIHVGGPGTSGPVIIPIPNPPLRISGSFGQTWTWKASDFTPNPGIGLPDMDSFLQACAAGNCYLNWHTTVSGGGAVRVQLCPKSAAANTANGIAVCTSGQ